jgi:hypothetical protein
MPLELGLIWLALVVSIVMATLSAVGALPNWPKIYIVTALSNVGVLSLFYMPGLSGYSYYLIGIIKIIPLIMLLVYLAQKDPAPNWTYRALCWVFILQIVTSGWHILAGLDSPYYDQLSLIATVAELIIIFLGGYNVRFTRISPNPRSSRSAAYCSTWARRYNESGERRECPKG